MFDQDPNEQANISGADLAIMVDEIKNLTKQRDELVAALSRAVQAITVFRNEQSLKNLHKLRASVGYIEMENAMHDGKEAIASVKDES